MPVSAEVSTKKEQSRTEILCDQMDDIISNAQKQVTEFDKIKKDLEFEPGLLKKALSMKLGSPEDLKQVTDEMKEWKTEVKSEVKSAVISKKNELKLERKARRKNLQQAVPEQARTAPRKKKKRGGFI